MITKLKIINNLWKCQTGYVSQIEIEYHGCEYDAPLKKYLNVKTYGIMDGNTQNKTEHDVMGMAGNTCL